MTNRVIVARLFGLVLWLITGDVVAILVANIAASMVVSIWHTPPVPTHHFLLPIFDVPYVVVALALFIHTARDLMRQQAEARDE